MKVKVFSPVVGEAPELLAASYVLCIAYPQVQGGYRLQKIVLCYIWIFKYFLTNVLTCKNIL